MKVSKVEPEKYMHFLCRGDFGNGLGWYAPVEVSGSNLSSAYLVIPVHKTKFEAFSEGYNVETVGVRPPGKGNIDTYNLFAKGGTDRRKFILKTDIGDFPFNHVPFKSRNRYLSYKGKLKHSDFDLPLVAVEPMNEDFFDKMFDKGKVFLGCCPFENYEGAIKMSEVEDESK